MDGDFGNVIKKFLSFKSFNAADEASDEAEEDEQPQEMEQAETMQVEEEPVEEGMPQGNADDPIMEQEELTGPQDSDAFEEDAVNWSDGDAQLEIEGDTGAAAAVEKQEEDLSSLSVGELHRRCVQANVNLPGGTVGKAKLVQLLAAKLGLRQGGPVEPAGPPPPALVANKKRTIDSQQGRSPKSGMPGGSRPPSFPPPAPPHQPGLIQAPATLPQGSQPPVAKSMPGRVTKAPKLVATAKKGPKPPAVPPPQSQLSKPAHPPTAKGPKPPAMPPPQSQLPKPPPTPKPPAVPPPQSQPSQPPHPPTASLTKPELPGPLPPTAPPPLSVLAKSQQEQAKQQLQDQLKKARATELLQYLSQKLQQQQQQQLKLQVQGLQNQPNIQQVQAAAQATTKSPFVQSSPPAAASSASSTTHSAKGGLPSAFEEATQKMELVDLTENDKKEIYNLGQQLQLDDAAQIGLMLLSREKLRPILDHLPKVSAPVDMNNMIRICISRADPSVGELLKRMEAQESEQILTNNSSSTQPPTGHAAPKTPPKAPPKAIPKAPPKTDTKANAKAAARTALLAAQASAASSAQPLQPPKATQPEVVAASIPPQKVPPRANMHIAGPNKPHTVPPTAKTRTAGSPTPQTVPPSAKTHVAVPPKVIPPMRPQQPVQPGQQPVQPAGTPGFQQNSKPPLQCNPRPASTQELRSKKVALGATNPRPPGKGRGASTALPGKGVAQRARSRSRSPPAPKQPQPPTEPPPPKAPNGQLAAAGQPRDELDAWLLGLDDKGVMLQYSAAVHREFDSVSQLTAAVVDPTAVGLKVVEPAIWETLGIKALGHKLHFSKGLQLLVSGGS